jgi:hypothetical protein
MRRLDRAKRLPDEAQTIEDRLVAGCDRAADGGVMALDVFGGGEQSDVRTEVERAQQQRGEKGVVYHQQQTRRAGDGCDGRHVREFERGVRRCLDKDQLGGWLDSRLYGCGIRCIHEARLNPEVAQHLVEEAHRAAINDVGEHDVIAGLEQCEKDGGYGRHARSETDRGWRVFQRPQRLFQSGYGRVRGTGIGVALVDAHGILTISRRLVDGGKQGTGSGVGMHSAADGAGQMRVKIKGGRSSGALGSSRLGIRILGIRGRIMRHGNPPGTGMSNRDNRNHRGTLGGVCTRGERFRLLAWTADRLGFAWP